MLRWLSVAEGVLSGNNAGATAGGEVATMTSNVSLPNLITMGRLALVPLVLVAITEGRLDIAFWLFIAAGVSDAVDGFLARRFKMMTELGAYLDPLADKALLLGVYATLGVQGAMPQWLVILVWSRDLAIVGAILLSWIMHKKVEIRPLFVSKMTTAGQIVLVALVMAEGAFHLSAQTIVAIGQPVVAALTAASGSAYLWGWLQLMSRESEHG